MTNSAQLCAQCHGNLRFPHTDHLSYNIETGTGGIGVTNQQTMPGAACTDCHMFNSGIDGSNSKMFSGHSWAVIVPEVSGTNTASCTACHADMDAQKSDTIIHGTFQPQFDSADATASASVGRVARFMDGVTNATVVATFDEAQRNLTYAESDESHGFHNHSYVMALLNDADAKARSLPILDTSMEGANVVISWTGSGTLQSADSITGVWQDVAAVTNPFVVPLGTHGRGQFYRLRP
jgi:hypothetical protein